MALCWLAISPAHAAMVPTAQFSAEPERVSQMTSAAREIFALVGMTRIEVTAGSSSHPNRFSRHPRVSGDLARLNSTGIPAFAGMTYVARKTSANG